MSSPWSEYSKPWKYVECNSRKNKTRLLEVVWFLFCYLHIFTNKFLTEIYKGIKWTKFLFFSPSRNSRSEILQIFYFMSWEVLHLKSKPRESTQVDPLESYLALQKYIHKLISILTRKEISEIYPEEIDRIIGKVIRRVTDTIEQAEWIKPHFCVNIKSGTEGWESFEWLLRGVAKRLMTIGWENIQNGTGFNEWIPIYDNSLSSVSINIPWKSGYATSLLELTMKGIIGSFWWLYYTLLQRERDAIESRKKAITDPLTEWLRRWVLQHPEITHPFDKAREDINSQFALYIIDLNKFKPINDTYGHHIWDEVLKLTVHRILEVLPEWISDIKWLWDDFLLYRSGGDEFVLYTKGSISGDLSEELKKAISQDIVLVNNGDGWHIDKHRAPWKDFRNRKTINVGAAIWRSDLYDDNPYISDMMKLADYRMYEDKRTRWIFAGILGKLRKRLSRKH